MHFSPPSDAALENPGSHESAVETLHWSTDIAASDAVVVALGQDVQGEADMDTFLYVPAAHAAMSLPFPVYPASARQSVMSVDADELLL